MDLPKESLSEKIGELVTRVLFASFFAWGAWYIYPENIYSIAFADLKLSHIFGFIGSICSVFAAIIFLLQKSS